MVRASIPRMKNTTPFNFYLFNVIVALPLYMGMRQQDMLDLKVSDVDMVGNRIYFGPRDLPLHPHMKKLLRKYLAYRAARLPDGEDHGLLLVRAGGKGNNTGREGVEKYHMSPQLLLSYYRKLSRESRVKVTHKILRDTYGYHLALSGAPHTVIMGAMGCRYETALRMINLASKTINVDEWYMDALADFCRDYKAPL